MVFKHDGFTTASYVDSKDQFIRSFGRTLVVAKEGRLILASGYVGGKPTYFFDGLANGEHNTWFAGYVGRWMDYTRIYSSFEILRTVAGSVGGPGGVVGSKLVPHPIPPPREVYSPSNPLSAILESIQAWPSPRPPSGYNILAPIERGCPLAGSSAPFTGLPTQW